MPLSLRAGMALRILERAPLVVVVLDGEGRLRHSNQFFHELSGYSPAELAGLPFAHLGLALPATDIAGTADPGTARTATLRTKAGERRHLEWTDAFDVEGDDGAPLTVRVARDVTAQEAAFEALTVSEQRLAEAHRVAQIGAWELDLHTGRVW